MTLESSFLWRRSCYIVYGVLRKCDFNGAINYLHYSWQHSTETKATTILAINTRARHTYFRKIFRSMTFPGFTKRVRRCINVKISRAPRRQGRHSRASLIQETSSGSRFVPRSILLSATYRGTNAGEEHMDLRKIAGLADRGHNAITRKSIGLCNPLNGILPFLFPLSSPTGRDKSRRLPDYLDTPRIACVRR